MESQRSIAGQARLLVGMTRRRFLAAGGLAVGSGLLAACGGSSSPKTPASTSASTTTSSSSSAVVTPTIITSSASAAPTAAAGKPGGTLVAGWEADSVGTLDPPKTLGAHENRLTQLYGDTLWTLFGDTTEVKPDLATTWQASADGLTWDVKLRPNVLFQDGTPVDAQAVWWNFDRWMNKNNSFYDGPYGLLAYYLAALQGVEKTGDLDLRFSLSKKDSMFVSNMLVEWAAIVSPTAVQKMGKDAFGNLPICSGPFQVTTRETGVRIVLKRFDRYWNGPTKIDQLIVKPIVEDAQRLTSLQSGEVDLIVAMSPQFIPAIQSDSKLQLLQSPGMHIWWVALNMHDEIMKKKEVRQALNYAINKDAIVKQILNGAGVVTPGPMLPQSWANDPAAKPYPYDPKKAKDLLTAAGYPDGFSTKFWVPESGSGMIAPKDIAQVMQANLKEVGVKADIVTEEWTSYLHDWGTEGFDKDGKPLYGMAEMSWNFATPDPGFWLNPNVSSDSLPPAAFNGGFYSNSQVDDLLTKASLSFNQDERKSYFQQAQNIMIDDCPWIFMFSANNIAAASKRVQGVTLNPNPWILRLDNATVSG